MGNVFDDAANRKIPVNMMLNGEKTTVGQAEITPGVDGIMHVSMDLKSDDANDVIELLTQGMVEGYSVASRPKHRMTEIERQAVAGVVTHNHEPKQHRDGKPPWCNTCRLTADYTTPTSNFGFGQPANPLRGENAD